MVAMATPNDNRCFISSSLVSFAMNDRNSLARTDAGNTSAKPLGFAVFELGFFLGRHRNQLAGRARAEFPQQV